VLVGITLAAGARPAGPDKNGLGRTPPMGWNTWCTGSSCHQIGPVCNGHNCSKRGPGALHDDCNESMIKSVAQSMLNNGLNAAGYTWINLDDCWESVQRSADGSMTADPKRFPSGTLKELADWLHSRNFSLGMYTSAGDETCSTGQRSVPGQPQARGVPGSCSNVPTDKMSAAACRPSYERDAKTFASWGVDYIKLDWCSGYANRSELTGAFYRAVNASGRSMWLNFHCDGAYQSWCAEYGNSWRCGQDHHDNWPNTAAVIDNLGSAATSSGPYRWADPDFLMTGGAGCDGGEGALMQPGVRCPGQTDTEYKTEFSLWSIASAPLIVATDLRNLTSLQREVLLHRELIAINQDSDSSVNHGRVDKAGSAAAQVWVKSMSDGSMAVALYNSGTVAQDIGVAFAQLPGVSKKDTYQVRDVWNRKELGSFNASYTASDVPSHGTVVLRLW